VGLAAALALNIVLFVRNSEVEGENALEAPEELTRIAETGGMAELRRWAKSHIDELRAQPAAIEATYLALKQKSAGTAFLFAYILPKELTPEVAASDIATERTNNPGLWVVGVAHIRSGPILDRARHALDSGDVLFGLQRHYCAGSGPTPVIFTSMLDFEEHLCSTRPGDEFMLLSVRELSQRGELLQPNVPAVRNYLAANPSKKCFS
jgi:hypothetical protein